MKTIDTLTELEALYGPVSPRSVEKVRPVLSPLYRRWIGAARFVVLSTTGPDGTDGSPRGDIGPVARVEDETTLLLPDWQGNNRLDSLRNIVSDGRVSLMFMVPGALNVVRVNGRAVLTADPALTGSFEVNGKHPKTVIVVTVAEVYFQCAKALMRSELWSGGDQSEGLPSAGEFVREVSEDFDAAGYDAGYAAYARDRMW
ncbi:MAG: pyridoxamine 5'-phosphate oxidase family protein [Silicimonas sp.]|nr:pyridoxamine 5'-phosphate oxidase family protein [Silicimonas sp.]